MSPAEERSALAQLLHPFPLARFRSEHYPTRWLHVPRDRGALADLPTRAEVPSVLRTLHLADGDVAVVAGGGRQPVSDRARLDVLLAHGATLIVARADRHHAGLGRLVDELAAELGEWLRAWLYLSPVGGAGSAAHYDTHDSFVIQLEGEKRWTLYGSHDTFARLEDRSEERCPDEVEAEVVLNPGDVLFLPRGLWHAPSAISESLHVTINVMSRSGTDLLGWLAKQAGRDPAWRAPRPLPDGALPLIPSADDAALEHYEQLVGRLAGLLSQPDLLQRYLRDVAMEGHDREVARPRPTARWTAGTVLRRPLGLRYRTRDLDDEIEVLGWGTALRVPAALRPALSALGSPERAEVSCADLLDLPEIDHVELVRGLELLLSAGFLTISSSPH